MQDLANRTILITGANAGIGRSTAHALAARGARLVLAGRNEGKTLAAIDDITRATGNQQLRFELLDLSDLASVRACADRVAQQAAARGEGLHVLINNAGQAAARGLSKDGFEITFAANHLGPFLLTLRLLPLLCASAPARIVNVASRAHRRVKGIDFEAQRRPRGAGTGITEYSVSKLANILFTKALARRLGGTGVTTYAVHPGVVASDIWRRVPAPARGLMKLFMLSNDEGARTTLHCATAPEAAGETGLYYDRARVTRPTATAENQALAEELWARSVAWVGEDLPNTSIEAARRSTEVRS